MRRGRINGIVMEMREFTNLKSQIVTSSWSGSRVMDLSRIVTSYRIKQAPNIFAFTKQGVAMLTASLRILCSS